MQGRTILVTGGGTGIGRAFLEALAPRNRVIICGRREDRLRAASETCPGSLYRVCDIADIQSRAELVSEIEERFSGLDMLVNNAGILRPSDPLGDRFVGDLDDMLDTNLRAPLLLSHALLPVLRRRDNPMIVNVGSGLADMPIAAMGVYCATKAALHSISRSLRAQLEPHGVRVVEALAPVVDTELSSGVQGRKISPQRFVSEVLDRIAHGEDEIRVGQARLLYRMTRIAPSFIFRRLNEHVIEPG